MYRVGESVPADSAAAAGRYRKAAEQGYARAENNLGVMTTMARASHKTMSLRIDLRAIYRQPLASNGGVVCSAVLFTEPSASTNEVVPGFQSRENKFCSYLAAFGTILPINHSRCGSARL